MMMLTLNTFRNKMGKKNYISRTENKPCIDNQYTNKMLKKYTCFFIFLLLLVGITGFSQTFPVTISTQINQPSPIYWSNYADATTSNSPIKMQIVLNDLTIARRQVRLKCYWQGNGISFMNNDFVVGAQPLFLEGGVPLQLTNVNLAPYFEFQNIVGITPNQYAQAMPEGIYTLAVEVYDVATGQKLSRKSTVTVIIFQNESPLLNLPLNQVSIIQQNIQNILFSWTPRQINVSNVEYQFDLIEIWDQYTPVQNAFAYSKPIYTTTTKATTLQYGVAEPQLIIGKRYAWRIKAKALVGAEEIGVFKNNGYSEIFAFTYEVYCTPPLLISTEGVSQDQAKITWSGALDNFDYQVNYREKNADSQWYPLETPREYATLANLKPNTTYEYTVGASCEKGKYIHSSIQEFTTLAQDEIALVTCGIIPDPVDLSNLSPLDNLVPNDVIKAGDFPIVVIEATGGNGRFSGEGYVTLPLLERYRKLIDAADNLGEIPKKAAGIVTDAATVATALANHGATQVNNVVTKVEHITGQTINDPTKAVTDQIKSTAALVSDKANALAGMVPDYSTNIGKYTRIAVSFSDIGVNTDFKLISGSIIASYDPEWKSMIDLDPAFNEVFGDAGNVVNYEIDFIIETVIKNQDGTITITSTTGVVTVLDKTVNDIVITDKDGTQYTIPANAPAGPIKPSGQLAPGGVPTAANTNGMGAGGVVKQISSTDVSVVFTKGDGKYAFDTAPTTQNGKLSKSYKSIPQKSGGTYSIPFKAISNSLDSTDVIIATVDFKNGKTKDDIVFKTQNGTLIKSNWNENTAILKLKRTLDYAKETVIAAVRPTPAVQQNTTGSAQPAAATTVKPTDSKNSPKYDIAGTFNLWHLTHKKVNVTLVSVNGAAIPEDAASTLNQIYEPTGITFNVNTIPVFLNQFWEDTIETGNSDLLNTYTAEQQAITMALKTELGAEYATDTYYMLYTKEGTVKKDAGFMPLKRQFGFVFDGRNKTLAHELGHGVFGLQHPFKQYGTSKGSTDLLMDYGDGTTLNHNDWEITHAPGLQLYQFTQGSSAGAQIAEGFNYIMPNHKSFRFQTNDGKKDSDIINVNHINNGGHPNGTLYAFTINGKEYEFGFDSKKTTEAFYEKGSDIAYTNAFSKIFEEQSYRLLIQQAANSCNYYLAIRKKPNLLNPVLTILPAEVPKTASNCSKILLNEVAVNGGTIDCSLIAEIKIDNPGSIAFRVNRAVKECLEAIKTSERVSMINALLPYLGNIEDAKSKTALEAMNREIGDTKNFVSNVFNAGDQYDVGRAIAQLTSTGVENNDFQREIINIVKKNNYALLIKMLGECDFDEVTHPFIDEVSIAFMANPNVANTTRALEVLGETLRYPSSLMPYIIGLKPNESITSDKDQLNAQYTVLSKLPITFNSNGTINLKESYSEYFKGKGIDDMTFPSLYDNPTADPFEATIFLIGIDNNELGLQKDKVIVMPAIWGFCIEKAIAEHKKARIWRHVGNGAAVIGAIVAAVPSGGTSVVAAIAILGGEAAVLDELMMMSKDDVTFEQYQRNKELYEKWDLVYNSIMMVDGLVNAPELAKTLGGLVQRMRSISYLKSTGKFLKPEFVTSLKLALQDIGKYKNIAAIKLGIKNTINYTKFAFKSTDNYLDIIIHAKGNKFYVVVEGVVQEKSSKEIISILDNAPTGKTARLLSCNDEAAAIALSIETKKPFYASDGWVEINKNGDVFSEKDFYLYNRGTKGAKGSNYTKGNAPEGVEYLRLGDGVNGAGSLVPNSLITKLTQQGATELKAWTSGKSLSFVNEAGTVLTGANAEAKIFVKLETSIGSKAVLKTTTDTNGRLLVQTERGTNSNRVLSIEINKNGQVVVKEYAPSYKPTANTDIDVDLSKGMLAPDYTTKGGKYLYPKNSLQSGQNNVVEITMTGDMAKDFKAANEAAGFSSFGYKAPKLGEVQFTWHHLDDFNPITGKVSVQLVDQSAHTKVVGMGHSGGVAQYKTFNGSGY
ncbi:HNH endonuclease [Flavobacterium sp. XS1P32]|uniref:HNH endonuclease n=1 Tax=unclassified Flavobacterium TaxID=196869 RepID=UPI003AAB43CE